MKKKGSYTQIIVVIAIFGLLLLAILWSGVLYKVESERQAEIRVAIDDTGNFARAFNEHMARTILNADQMLLLLKYEYETYGSAMDMAKYKRGGPFWNDTLALDVLESPATLPMLRLPLEEESLPRLQELISGESAAAGVSAGMVDRLHILSDEVFSNLVNHAGGPGAQAVVSFEVAGQEAVLRFSDRGAPFDPLAQPLPDTSLPAERRDSGGLGILLVRKLADKVDYRCADGENRLILRVSTAPHRIRRQTKESSDG